VDPRLTQTAPAEAGESGDDAELHTW
jgi:hypothetical protein